MTEFLSAALWTTTITASAAALVVMALRLALKKLPRWLICVLWLPVFLRMVCPWGLPLPVSLVPAPVVQGISQPVLPVRPAAEPAWPDAAPAPAEQEPAPSPVLLVWAIGAAGMLAWTGGSAWRLRRRLAEAVQQEKGVYESDRVDSPFLLGWLRPRIYLPVGLSPDQRQHVLAHERAHWRRGDTWAKLLAWLALCLHWFNPLLWLAYRLLCRDLETACDQAVIRAMTPGQRADYAETLLCLGRRTVQPVGLAFGQEDTKQRVRHVLDFRRPPVLVAVVGAVVCVLTVLLILSNPVDKGTQLDGVSITQAYVLDGGLPVALPEESRHQLLTLLKQLDVDDYLAVDSFTLEDGDIVLSGQTGGTVFYLSDDPAPQLIRVNRDGYSATQKVSSASHALAVSPDYARWRGELTDYLTKDLADQIYALATPYIGSNSACGTILETLHLSTVLGPYTFSLQTGAPPYGITIHLEQAPPEEEALYQTYFQDVSTLFFALVGNAERITWQYGDQELATIAVQGSGSLDREGFRAAYAQLRADAGACRAAQS